ncbi:RNA polymerase sigma factor [Desulfurivibrio alkaliphilus]|uniref:RNA polymerase, sigma-24 subunit, ECF subfamily n=1 Tax=Desulfurivibrio alkaliphilus (strain DSM 19089 / UNIQEM U267 / AHT2) TaxID=589865 RepID=D6Z5Y3_DESAT|nr:RNA polymerase sigma factor [Desulfurivibrio alkaliphilus]ADH84865.1 RNA polymerase, sigma-24 subunit, ECF subfamily [Desulfurivibrio alkaliphilus AHT 2]
MRFEDRSDEELMAAYAAGDLDAFAVLYDRHRGRILGYLFSRLAGRDEAEEVFQKVFARLHESRQKYRAGTPFLPWMFVLMRNVLIDHVRQVQRRRRRLVYSEEAVLGAVAPETVAGSGRLRDGGYLDGLDARQRRALELRFEQGFSFAEISARLGLSTVNARQIISRALRRLRQTFGEQGNQR